MRPLFEKVAYATREDARRAAEGRWNVESYDGKFTTNVPVGDVSQLFVDKLATPVETRLKKRQRGWHFEKEPGFFDMKGKFEDAEKKNAEMKVAAISAALALYGIDPKLAGEITQAPDPVKAVTQVFHDEDFGFGLAPGKKPSSGIPRGPRSRGDAVTWGNPSGLAGADSFSRQPGGAGAGMQNGTGMSNQGV